MTASTPSAISRYRLLVLRAGLKLEMKGLRHSRGRWYSKKLIISELGLDSKMKPQQVLDAIEEHINHLDEEAARASHPHPLIP